MNYINISSKRLVGRNNNTVKPLCFDYECIEDISFQFLDSNNKIQSLSGGFDGAYLAIGSLGANGENKTLLALSQDYQIIDDEIIFTLDTYTEQWLNTIKKKWTEVNLEIGQYYGTNVKKVLCRETALACPRVYIARTSANSSHPFR